RLIWPRTPEHGSRSTRDTPGTTPASRTISSIAGCTTGTTCPAWCSTGPGPPPRARDDPPGDSHPRSRRRHEDLQPRPGDVLRDDRQWGVRCDDPRRVLPPGAEGGGHRDGEHHDLLVDPARDRPSHRIPGTGRLHARRGDGVDRGAVVVRSGGESDGRCHLRLAHRPDHPRHVRRAGVRVRRADVGGGREAPSEGHAKRAARERVRALRPERAALPGEEHRAGEGVRDGSRGPVLHQLPDLGGGPMTRSRLATRIPDYDVYEAAHDRIRWLFKEFDGKVAVTFSGGKDSTVTMEIAARVAREGGYP